MRAALPRHSPTSESTSTLRKVSTLNEVYSALSMRRRYEVWFVRLALADGSGAWWFRYLLMNPGRGGCEGNPSGLPVQVWATWFPHEAKPQSFIREFPLEGLDLSPRGQNPFHLRVARNEIDENSCRGDLAVNGHQISWDLRYQSTFRATMSNKGWIGFSRSPHSDAIFSGRITLDGRHFEAGPLGFGVQGHNCGYRHRSFWIWTHVFFARPDGHPPSTLEALMYEMPFGLVFRKAVLWHDRTQYVFRTLQSTIENDTTFSWKFRGLTKAGIQLGAEIEGNGLNVHSLPYLKTNCSGTFKVLNNSLSRAKVLLQMQGGRAGTLQTETGAVLEIAGGDYQARL